MTRRGNAHTTTVGRVGFGWWLRAGGGPGDASLLFETRHTGTDSAPAPARPRPQAPYDDTLSTRSTLTNRYGGPSQCTALCQRASTSVATYHRLGDDDVLPHCKKPSRKAGAKEDPLLPLPTQPHEIPRAPIERRLRRTHPLYRKPIVHRITSALPPSRSAHHGETLPAHHAGPLPFRVGIDDGLSSATIPFHLAAYQPVTSDQTADHCLSTP
jgi:hypothetical protein